MTVLPVPGMIVSHYPAADTTVGALLPDERQTAGHQSVKPLMDRVAQEPL